MGPEQSNQPPAVLAARQDRLELQLAELTTRLTELERQIAATPAVAPPRPQPPPPPLLPSITAPLTASPAPEPVSRASFEDRLGSQVFNRVGIIALLVGATWFLKLAVDNRWIGPAGRVLIGLLAGAAVVLWSERFRRNGFAAFSYSLKAIGSGVLYLALWASFHLYHLLPSSAALGAMLLVTAWNAYMAWVAE